MKPTKPRVAMRLFWESKDFRYDKEDRKRYAKIRRLVNSTPIDIYKKIILKSKDYEYYRGVCFGRGIKKCFSDIEYDILLAVIDNVKIGYYDGGNYEDEEEKICWKN